MKLSRITTDYVQNRTAALKSLNSEWNDRADEYEKVYLMDMWEESPEPDERRLAAPIAWTRVESYRAILLTKPPVITVPPSDARAVAEEQADSIEKFLYGMWYQANVMDALNSAEWYATCFGRGVLRCLYTDDAANDEIPLLVSGNIDPRHIYSRPSARKGQDAELSYSYHRTRREIEEEWGELPGHQDDEGWLDAEIEFIDYWRVDIEEVEEEGVEVEESRGLIETIVDKVTKSKRPVKKVKQRVVTNCILAGDNWLKKPVRMPGYSRIPFIQYAGISTPLKGADGWLSVLFPITGGSQVGTTNCQGLVAAYCEGLAHRQRIVEMYANAATVVTGTDQDVELDFSPTAQNQLPQGAKVDFLVPPGPHPAADKQLQILEQGIEDATVSASMMGRMPGNVSGLALSAMASPILMRLAHRQQDRERALQQLNSLILSLAEFYSGPDGWQVWGSHGGQAIDMVVYPEDIGGYYRNIVKLSASLPKDANGEVMMWAGLVAKDLISHETFLDQLQQAKGTIRQSPLDEIQAILRDKMLFGGEMSEKIAQIIVEQYSAELADILGIGAQEVGTPPPAPGPMPPIPPSGPMQGMPPGVVPPMPEMVGEQNLPGMMAMQGNPPPMPPPMPEAIE